MNVLRQFKNHRREIMTVIERFREERELDNINVIVDVFIAAFSFEEQLMMRSKFPRSADHEIDHGQFFCTLTSIVYKFETEGNVDEKMTWGLFEQMRDHLEMDKELIQYYMDWSHHGGQ